MLEDFLPFLTRSPTAFHACREIAMRLSEAGFTPLSEETAWTLEPGKGYFLIRGGALLAAFRLSQKPPAAAVIAANHLDSPALKLKPKPEILNFEIGQLGTEVYGAPLLHTWLDRDLMMAGRLEILDSSDKAQSILVSFDDLPVIIPGLAIHLDRSVTDKGLLVQKQDHLKPIFSLPVKEQFFEPWLQKRHPFKKLLSFDLFLVPTEKPSLLGANGEFVASYRLDNLSSAYACLFALLHAKPQLNTLQLCLFWDHEEVGSTSYVGANSLFVDQILERVCLFFNMGREDYYRLKSRSLCLSSDLGHGYHPSFADKYDPQNTLFIGKGVALKFNANQKYATSSTTATPLVRLAEKHHIPLQRFACRSDIPSGSTVGSIMAATSGIQTVDIGIASWSMHSARETIGKEDEIALCRFLKAALEELPYA